jgi:hypothetical protein
MKKCEWKRGGNRIKIHTGHSDFDRQADGLMVGNVYGNVQHSSYIRPRTELECNGRTNQPGHLREFDLNGFNDLHHFYKIKCEILEITNSKTCILYEFRSFRVGRKTVHGYVLTDGVTHKLIKCWVVGPTYKSRNVIEAVIPYISE